MNNIKFFESSKKLENTSIVTILVPRQRALFLETEINEIAPLKNDSVINSEILHVANTEYPKNSETEIINKINPH